MLKYCILAALLLQLALPTLQQDDDILDIRIRFGPTTEAMINDQISREYRAMFMYEAMTSYFGRPSVALPGFQKMFKKAADEEREHAHKLIDYLNKRGGHVKMKSVPAHHKYEWSSALDAVKSSLEAEKEITGHLYSLRDKADEEKDTHLVDYVESEFLTEQVDGIHELRHLAAKLARVGSGLGEHVVDKELLMDATRDQRAENAKNAKNAENANNA